MRCQRISQIRSNAVCRISTRIRAARWRRPRPCASGRKSRPGELNTADRAARHLAQRRPLRRQGRCVGRRSAGLPSARRRLAGCDSDAVTSSELRQIAHRRPGDNGGMSPVRGSEKHLAGGHINRFDGSDELPCLRDMGRRGRRLWQAPSTKSRSAPTAADRNLMRAAPFCWLGSEKSLRQGTEQHHGGDYPHGGERGKHDHGRGEPPRRRRLIAEQAPVTTDHHATGAGRGSRPATTHRPPSRRSRAGSGCRSRRA